MHIAKFIPLLHVPAEIKPDLEEQNFRNDVLATSLRCEGLESDFAFFSPQDELEYISKYQFSLKAINQFGKGILSQLKELLGGSVSLTVYEKIEIFKNVENISDYQLDSLITILIEEKIKFYDLAKKYFI